MADIRNGRLRAEFAAEPQAMPNPPVESGTLFLPGRKMQACATAVMISVVPPDKAVSGGEWGETPVYALGCRANFPTMASYHPDATAVMAGNAKALVFREGDMPCNHQVRPPITDFRYPSTQNASIFLLCYHGLCILLVTACSLDSLGLRISSTFGQEATISRRTTKSCVQWSTDLLFHSAFIVFNRTVQG